MRVECFPLYVWCVGLLVLNYRRLLAWIKCESVSHGKGIGRDKPLYLKPNRNENGNCKNEGAAMNLNPFHFRQAHPYIVGTTPVSVVLYYFC